MDKEKELYIKNLIDEYKKEIQIREDKIKTMTNFSDDELKLCLECQSYKCVIEGLFRILENEN